MSSSIILETKYYLLPAYITGRNDWEIGTFGTDIHTFINLENYINTNGFIHPSIASRFLIQLAYGIGKLHSCGIIMSVLEMSDIMIDITNQNIYCIYLKNPCAIIYDPLFRKKALVKDKRSQSVYRAPECKDSICYDGFPADVYALGIIFYKMIFGSYPEYDSFSGIKSSIESLYLCGDVSPEIVAMITLMLEPNPLIRPSIVNILNVKWVNKIRQVINVTMPCPCMTFPYFYCKQEYLITHVPPFNQPKHFIFTQQTHDIEANYSNALATTQINIDKSLELYKSCKTFKTEVELEEKIFIGNVNKYLELVQYDVCMEDITSLKNKIDSDKIKIFLMKNVLSIKIQEVKQSHENVQVVSKYEIMCNWYVIFNRFHGHSYVLL
jgi:serine/threonine protein kinase